MGSQDSDLSPTGILLYSLGQVPPAQMAEGLAEASVLFQLSHCDTLLLLFLLGVAAEEEDLKLGASSSVWPLLLPLSVPLSLGRCSS